MNFIEYCITKGYKAYRKVFNLSLKKWEYVETTNTSYFSSIVNGYVDIRLIKEGFKEIVYGIPCIFSPKDEFTRKINTKIKKTHFPTLIYPNPFGDIYEVDRVFEELSFEKILNEIEKNSMDYLSTEWLIEWARTHCMSDEELYVRNKAALEEANIVMDKIKETEITVEPITFKTSSFTSARVFSKTMFLAAEYFKDNNDIVVRYSKPENKESGEVTVCFQILKSKAKMFLKYLVETKEKLTFTLSSNKDIKSCIKSLNSLGVKGDKGEPLSSKNTDYGSNIKDSIEDSGKVACITVEYDDEYGCPILDWDLIEDNGSVESYSIVKERINEIIKTV